jgi:hypothetical protein
MTEDRPAPPLSTQENKGLNMPDQIWSYWDLVGPIFTKIDIDSPSGYFASIAVVPRPLLLLYAAHLSLSEIRNGGLLQFFWNSTGLIAPEAADGFTAIGMPKIAALLTTAVNSLGSPYPRDRDDRWDALLVASGRSEQDLKAIFENEPNLYLAFAEAVKPLGFNPMERDIWALAETESGGFDIAATRYAETHHPIQ